MLRGTARRLELPRLLGLVAGALVLGAVAAATLASCDLPLFTSGPRATLDPAPGTYSEVTWVEPRGNDNEQFFISFEPDTPYTEFKHWYDNLEVSGTITFWYYSIAASGERSAIKEATYTISDTTAPVIADAMLKQMNRSYYSYWVVWRTQEQRYDDATGTDIPQDPQDNLTGFWQLEYSVYSSNSKNIGTLDEAETSTASGAATQEMVWMTFDQLRQIRDQGGVDQRITLDEGAGLAALKVTAARPGAHRFYNVFVRDASGNAAGYGMRRFESSRIMSLYVAEDDGTGATVDNLHYNDGNPDFSPGFMFGDTVDFLPVATANDTVAVALGNLNGDDYDDLFVLHRDSASVTLLYQWCANQANGTFNTVGPHQLLTPAPADDFANRNVVLTDFNGDGLMEMVFAAPAITGPPASPASVYVFDASLPVAGPLASYVTAATRVAAGDVDGDGDPDVVALDESSGNVTILRNDTGVAVTSAGSFNTGGTTTDIELADLDLDGMADIIVAVPLANPNILIYKAVGGGSFTRSTASDSLFSTYMGYGTNNISVADFVPTVDGDRRDGLPDLFAGNSTGPSTLFRNEGGMSFSGPLSTTVSFSAGSRDSTVADMNGDGWPDIMEIVTNTTPPPPYAVQIWLNDSGNDVQYGPAFGSTSGSAVAAGQLR